MLRILLVAALVAAALFVVKKDRVLERLGLFGYCTPLPVRPGESEEWRVCRDGKLAGRLDLSIDSCTSRGIVRGREYWLCP